MAHERTLPWLPPDARLPGAGGFRHTTNSHPTGSRSMAMRRELNRKGGRVCVTMSREWVAFEEKHDHWKITCVALAIGVFIAAHRSDG